MWKKIIIIKWRFWIGWLLYPSYCKLGQFGFVGSPSQTLLNGCSCQVLSAFFFPRKLDLFFSEYFLHFEFAGVDLSIKNQSIVVTPSPLPGHSASRGSKDVLLCERVQVSGISRLKLGSYATAFRVTFSPSLEIPERFHSKIQVCFHR